ncbi:hypothetical protein [Hydrogenophaga sp. MI9]|uniref:hypothetical protein n=1 Tax=Hydrogenophaga sp. MI9 TaxID=3453719 RepID=UPI003EEA08BB
MKPHFERESMIKAAIQRRQFNNYLLSSAAAIGLTACGGGGGGSDAPTLREAFDRLQPGMTKRQVYELVGRTPSSSSSTIYHYNDGAEHLIVSFDADSTKNTDDFILRDATWNIIDGERIFRGYL